MEVSADWLIRLADTSYAGSTSCPRFIKAALGRRCTPPLKCQYPAAFPVASHIAATLASDFDQLSLEGLIVVAGLFQLLDLLVPIVHTRRQGGVVADQLGVLRAFLLQLAQYLLNGLVLVG